MTQLNEQLVFNSKQREGFQAQLGHITRRAGYYINQGTTRFILSWNQYLHPICHYGTLPAIFAFGLWWSNEFTLRPVELFRKLLIQ